MPRPAKPITIMAQVGDSGTPETETVRLVKSGVDLCVFCKQGRIIYVSGRNISLHKQRPYGTIAWGENISERTIQGQRYGPVSWVRETHLQMAGINSCAIRGRERVSKPIIELAPARKFIYSDGCNITISVSSFVCR